MPPLLYPLPPLMWLTPLPRTFTRVGDAPTHLTFQLPNWSCRLSSMRRRGSRLLPFWGSEVHYAVSFLTLNLLGSVAHLRSPHTG